MHSDSFPQLLASTVDALSNSAEGLFHENAEGDTVPSAQTLNEIAALCRAIFFPGYYGDAHITPGALRYSIGAQVERLYHLLVGQIRAGLRFSPKQCRDMADDQAEQLAAKTIAALPHLRHMLSTDVEAAYAGDPAATDIGEVISCYPIIKALTNYRLAHELHLMGVPIIPRILTELAHSETGIDIHPGAQIGEYFTIDHGTGVVIGATTIIGHHVKLYQGVTLGAKSFDLDANGNPVKGIPRHPIIEDNVIVYSNATILGRITIGRGAIIGGNLWITEDIPAGAKVVQARRRPDASLKVK